LIDGLVGIGAGIDVNNWIETPISVLVGGLELQKHLPKAAEAPLQLRLIAQEFSNPVTRFHHTKCSAEIILPPRPLVFRALERPVPHPNGLPIERADTARRGARRSTNSYV